MMGKQFRPMGEDFQEAVMAVRRACPHRNDKQDAVAIRTAALAMAGLRSAPTFGQVMLAASWARMRPTTEVSDTYSLAATKDAAARMVLAFDPSRADNVKSVMAATGLPNAVKAMAAMVYRDPNRMVREAAREIKLVHGKDDQFLPAIISAVHRRVTHGTLFENAERISAVASTDLSYMKASEKAWATLFAGDVDDALSEADAKLYETIGRVSSLDEKIGAWFEGASEDFAVNDTFNDLEKIRREIDAIKKCSQDAGSMSDQAVVETCAELNGTVERLQKSLKGHASTELSSDIVKALRDQYTAVGDLPDAADRMIKCESALSDLGAINRSFEKKGDGSFKAISEETKAVAAMYFMALKQAVDGTLGDPGKVQALAEVVTKASEAMKPVLKTFHPNSSADRHKALAQPSIQVLTPAAEMLRKQMGCISYSRESAASSADEAKAIIDAYKVYCSTVGPAGPIYVAAKEVYLAMPADERVGVLIDVRKDMGDPTLKAAPTFKAAKEQKRFVGNMLSDMAASKAPPRAVEMSG
ncbi:MAG: hypothetical protein VR70_04060 [Rhodospirillaceae bacterium BRH_c57]|nr:MAG: hypothetical protein VR70_04060 [Rhodospirillaceae bacterium BRH_c57]